MDDPVRGTTVKLIEGKRGKIINVFNVHVNGEENSSKIYCIKVEGERKIIKLARFQFDIIEHCPGSETENLVTGDEHVAFYTNSAPGIWEPFSPISRTNQLQSTNLDCPKSSMAINISDNSLRISNSTNTGPDNPETSNDVNTTPRSSVTHINSNTKKDNSNNILTSEVNSTGNGDIPTTESVVVQGNTSNMPIKQNKRKFANVSNEDIDKYIIENENKNTARKTKADMNILNEYLEQCDENRPIYTIPPIELNKILCKFFMVIQKPDGSNYEPDSLRAMLASFQRHLKHMNYGYSLSDSIEFTQLADVFKRKKEELKRDGKGNRPKSSDALTEAEINKLYENKQLSISKDPNTLLRALWFHNSVQFGKRAVTEHYNMKWGDIKLHCDDQGNEFLEYCERNTKTRTGKDPGNKRKIRPRAFAVKSDPDQCPVEAYKMFKAKRPPTFCDDEHPFYIAANTNLTKSSKWFVSQRVGENKIASFMRTMAENAGIDLTSRKVSNTSARKFMIQTLNDHGIEPTKIMQISGHKNVQSINNYSHLNMEQQKDISQILSHRKSSSTSSISTMPVTFESSVPHSTHARPQAHQCSSSGFSHNVSSVSQCNNEVDHFNAQSSLHSLGCIFGGNVYGGTFNIQIHK